MEETDFYPHLGGKGVKWISLRTRRGDTCSFFPEKRTKNLVTQKTRFFIRAIALLPRLPMGFVVFQYPIS